MERKSEEKRERENEKKAERREGGGRAGRGKREACQ